ncbi:hypothetical protein IEQ34_010273 [Dendrobium chrysotoxum]|uniref:Uncharacterized protein n=1 Tax=Dendrobium chrysotoxum TaxID=161865 RepID=A0AAV7H589_DENCH|nr:hypothetical protein IEQ34_010273 [Dendrobium chrysotoxum]
MAVNHCFTGLEITLYTSAFAVIATPEIHSGATYPRVPRVVANTLLKSLPTSFANPKSETLGDVLRLNVTVDDTIVAFLVEIGDPPCRADGNAETRRPAEPRSFGAAAEVGAEGTVGHVVIDEEAVGIFYAEATEADKVYVLYASDGAHFRAKLAVAAAARAFEPLNGYRRGIRKRAAKNRAKTSVPKLL